MRRPVSSLLALHTLDLGHKSAIAHLLALSQLLAFTLFLSVP